MVRKILGRVVSPNVDDLDNLLRGLKYSMHRFNIATSGRMVFEPSDMTSDVHSIRVSSNLEGTNLTVLLAEILWSKPNLDSPGHRVYEVTNVQIFNDEVDSYGYVDLRLKLQKGKRWLLAVTTEEIPSADSLNITFQNIAFTCTQEFNSNLVSDTDIWFESRNEIDFLDLFGVTAQYVPITDTDSIGSIYNSGMNVYVKVGEEYAVIKSDPSTFLDYYQGRFYTLRDVAS